jgi:DNA-binding transcriptional LysR family regulator
MEAQISTACAASGLARRVVAEVVNLQYLVEFVRHGAGVAVLPPGALPAGSAETRAVPAEIRAVPITPPIHRDLCAVVPGRRAPTGPAQALLDAVLEAGRATSPAEP